MMKMEETNYPMILTVEHIEEVLSISKPTAYELMERKGFPLIRIGRRKRCNRQVVLNTFCSLILNTFRRKQRLSIFYSMAFPLKVNNLRAMEEAI